MFAAALILSIFLHLVVGDGVYVQVPSFSIQQQQPTHQRGPAQATDFGFRGQAGTLTQNGRPVTTVTDHGTWKMKPGPQIGGTHGFPGLPQHQFGSNGGSSGGVAPQPGAWQGSNGQGDTGTGFFENSAKFILVKLGGELARGQHSGQSSNGHFGVAPSGSGSGTLGHSGFNGQLGQTGTAGSTFQQGGQQSGSVRFVKTGGTSALINGHDLNSGRPAIIQGLPRTLGSGYPGQHGGSQVIVQNGNLGHGGLGGPASHKVSGTQFGMGQLGPQNGGAGSIFQSGKSHLDRAGSHGQSRPIHLVNGQLGHSVGIGGGQLGLQSQSGNGHRQPIQLVNGQLGQPTIIGLGHQVGIGGGQLGQSQSGNGHRQPIQLVNGQLGQPTKIGLGHQVGIGGVHLGNGQHGQPIAGLAVGQPSYGQGQVLSPTGSHHLNFGQQPRPTGHVQVLPVQEKTINTMGGNFGQGSSSGQTHMGHQQIPGQHVFHSVPNRDDRQQPHYPWLTNHQTHHGKQGYPSQSMVGGHHVGQAPIIGIYPVKKVYQMG